MGVEPAALLPDRPHADWDQAAMELGAAICTARPLRCERCPAAPWCASRGLPAEPSRGASASPVTRFEDSDRWVRGRIVAALVADAALPTGIEPARLRRALDGLERDGLVERSGARVGLPRRPR